MKVWGIQDLEMLWELPSCLGNPSQEQSDMISHDFTSYTASSLGGEAGGRNGSALHVWKKVSKCKNRGE